MRLYGKTAILIPHMSEDDKADWMRITIDAPDGIDRRRVWRGIRKFLQNTFGVTVSNDFVRRCCMIINQHDQKLEATPMSTEEKRNFMDRLVISIQEEEDRIALEARGHSGSEADVTQEAEVDMPSLQSCSI